MTHYKKLAITSLLSVTILAGVAWLGAEPAAKSDAAKSKNLVKSDVNSGFDSIDANLKVRYIDVFGAMRECKEGMQESEKLESVRKDLASNIQAEGKKLETAMTKYKTEAPTLNDSARAKREQELTKMKRDYENTVQSGEEQMKLVMQQVTEQLAKEIEQAVVEIAKNEGLDAVVDKMTGRVVYVKDTADYTVKVVKVMNKNYDYKLANNSKSKAAKTVTA